MRHGERICHLNASLTNPIQVRFEKAVRATEVTNMVHYREIVTGMVLENNQRTLIVARELSQWGKTEYGYSGLRFSTFVERQPWHRPKFSTSKDQNKIRQFSKEANL